MSRLRQEGAWLALLLAVALAVAGRPVPSGNELLYLLAPYRLTHPAFLAGDWTYAVPWNEHLVFNWTVGALMLAIPPVVMGWLGRLVCWTLILAGLLQLGRRFGLTPALSALGIAIWLGAGQALVGGEWMIGGFEAKVVAYVLLVFALNRLLEGREKSGGILLGLSFTLHPAVGMQGAIAAAVGLLFLRWPPARLARTGVWATVFALPGIVTALMLVTGQPTGAAEWRLVVLGRMPWHVDPWTFPYHLLTLLALMLLFNLLWFRLRREDQASRFFAGFQLALLGFFLLGIAFRALGWFPGMELTPFRLLPLFVPLLFWWQLAAAWREGELRRPLLAAAALLALTGHAGVIRATGSRLLQTVRFWQETDPVDPALRWIAAHTPPGAVVLAPPGIRQSFWLMRRGQVVSWDAIRYDRLGEWRRRLEALGAPPPAAVTGVITPDSINAAFLSLPADSLRALARSYRTGWLLSRPGYPFPQAARFGEWVVYQLREAGKGETGTGEKGTGP